MCRFLRVAAITTAVVAMASLSAAAVDLQPGLWEVSSRSERAGVVTQRPTRTKCITPEKADIIRSRDFPVSEFSSRGHSCKIIDLQQTDREMTWRMACAGLFPAEQMVRYVIHTPQHYTSELTSSVKLSNKTMSSVRVTEGRRIGECPK